MTEIIQVLHKWTANIMIILFIYSSIMWFWLANDKDKIKNASFRILITLEMITSGFLLILGVCVIISNPDWFTVKGIYIKMILGLMAIGVIHIGAGKTKKFIESDMGEEKIKPINIIRAIAIILLMTTYTTGTMIRSLSDKSTQNEIQKIKDGSSN